MDKLFCGGFLLIFALSLLAGGSFHASFDKDFPAHSPDGREIIAIAKNLKLVPGINGNGVHVPENGVLTFPADGIFNKDRGSIVFWLKSDRTPWGTSNFRDRNKDIEGNWTDEVESSPFNRNLLKSGNISLLFNSYVKSQIAGGLMEISFRKQLYAGEWHMVALTYDRKGVIRYYFDGLMVHVIAAGGEPVIAGKNMELGKTDSFSGFGGTLDEFSVYQEELSPDAVAALYAKHRPYRLELLDYALEAGKESRIRFRVRNLTGKPLKRTIDIDGRGINLDLAPGELKELTLNVRPEAVGGFRIVCEKDSVNMQIFELYALAPEIRETAKSGEIRKRLLREIDCTATPPRNGYSDNGTRVVNHCYREAIDAMTGVGFFYRFEIENQGNPHWVEVEYPDDAKREFSVNVFYRNYGRIFGGTLDCMGILTGGDHRITNTMKTKSLLFWPDAPEITVGVMGYKRIPLSKPAAASKIRLYVNDGPLPEAAITPQGRSIGIWDEDPTMDSGLAFTHAINFKDSTLENYAIKWQRIIDYMRFMGINVWNIKVVDYNGDATGMKATLENTSPQLSSEGRLPGWDSLGAFMLDRAGMDFYARINHRAIFWVDRPTWFARLGGLDNQEKLYHIDASGQPVKEPNYLHPAALKAYQRLIAAYRDKFGKYKHFRGITLNEEHDPSFGSIRNGYDNATTSLFEKETGIAIPGKTPRERAGWLLKNVREQWIRWRCKKTAQFVRKLVETIRAGVHDDLTIQYWIPARYFLSGLENWPKYDAGKALLETGIDSAMLREIPGLQLVPSVRPDYWRHMNKISSDEPHLIFSPEFAAVFKGEKNPVVNVFRHSNLEIYPDIVSDADKAGFKFKPFWAPVGTNTRDTRFYSYATPHPNSEFALETMVHFLAELDAQFIFHGWWGMVESGENELFRNFYTAFRNIPAGKFELAPGINDPVALRIGGSGYYLVNREGYPVTLDMVVDSEKKTRRLNGSEIVYVKTPHRPQIAVTGVSIPEQEVRHMNSQLTRLESARKKNPSNPKFDLLISEVRKALEEKRYSRVRHLMLTGTAREALNEQPLVAAASFCWLKKSITVSLYNIGPDPFEGTIGVDSCPEKFKVLDGTQKVSRLNAGEKAGFVFRFEGKELPGQHDIFKFAVEGNGVKEVFPWTFNTRFATEQDFEQPFYQSALSLRWSTGLTGEKYEAVKIDSGGKELHVRYTLQWNRKSSGVRFYAEVDDPDFIPPKRRGHMYDAADSIQIYFDQTNNAMAKYTGYDADDVVFQLGLLDGKPEVFQEYPASKVIEDIPLTIIREKGKTVYDAFIPRKYLPRANLKPGGTIGFGILVSQRMKSRNGGEYTIAFTENGSPYLHPENWVDWHFSVRRPNSFATIEVRPEGTLELTAVSGLKPDGRSYKSTSPELGEKVSVFTVGFTPFSDGEVMLTLGNPWNSTALYTKIEADGANIVNGTFSEYHRTDVPKGWQYHQGLMPEFTGNGVRVVTPRVLYQKIRVKKNVPVTITVSAMLPEEAVE